MRTRPIGVRTLALAAAMSILVLFAVEVVNGPAEKVHAQGASADYFLKIEGIKGDSLNDQHKDEIEVESWSWGESNPSRPLATPGSGAGKVSMKDFHFTIRGSTATPHLFLASAQGKVIPSATLTGTTDNGQTFVRWELKNVIVSSFNTEGQATLGPPMDRISLKFTQIVVTYARQNADGSTSNVRAGWDLGTNKKV